jgi:hypothetical protein
VIILSTLLWEGTSFSLSAASDLVFEPIIGKTEYCRDSAGSITLRLQLELRSQTVTEVPLLIPLFAQMSGYEIFRDEVAVQLNRVESGSSLHLEKALDATKLSPREPDPRLFRIVRIGETASWHASLMIPVMATRPNGVSLLGTNRYLRVRMNPWPADRKTGESLRRLWQSHGLLWMTEVVSSPVRIHIEQEPKASACWMRVD